MPGVLFYCFFDKTRRGPQVMGPRRRSSGPLLAIWRVYGDAKGSLNSANFLIAVRSPDRTVVNFTAPRGACEMMISVVKTLDPRKYRRGLTPVELDTRLAAGAGHLKNSAYRTNRSIILPCSRDSESLRHFQCYVLEILKRVVLFVN